MFDVVLEEGHSATSTDFVLGEVEEGLNVKSVQPQPFRAVVIAEALSCDVVVCIVVVVVVLAV